MPRMGFEPMIPAIKRAKTVHTLDRAATVIGGRCIERQNSDFSEVESTTSNNDDPHSVGTNFEIRR
jgi:hypothetical protein